MNPNTCVNCGAGLPIAVNTKYIVCEYCKTSNSNFSSFENFDLLEIDHSPSQEDANSLRIAYKLKDYSDVKKIATSILLKDPHSWLALTFLAIADFWTGYDDFRHLGEIKSTIEKAMTISNKNEVVFDAASKIANSAIIIGAKKAEYGDDFKTAIAAFDIADSICTIDDTSRQVLGKYCLKAFDYQKKKLDELVTKMKADYDPPYVSISNLYDISRYIEDVEVLEYFYLHASVHYMKNKTKTYASDLLSSISKVEEVLKKKGSSVVGKAITFNMFGKMKIA